MRYKQFIYQLFWSPCAPSRPFHPLPKPSSKYTQCRLNTIKALVCNTVHILLYIKPPQHNTALSTFCQAEGDTTSAERWRSSSLPAIKLLGQSLQCPRPTRRPTLLLKQHVSEFTVSPRTGSNWLLNDNNWQYIAKLGWGYVYTSPLRVPSPSTGRS